MPTKLILIDTDVLIDYSRGIEQSRELLKKLDNNHILSISVITKLELIIGCENKAAFKSLQEFLSAFEVIQLDSSISQIAVQLFNDYRLSHGVLIPDMLIASTALSYDIPLLSKNRKDFRFIDDLDLLEYNIG